MHNSTTPPRDTPLKVDQEIGDFLVDRKAANLSPRTVRWYTVSLKVWREYCVTNQYHTTETITPTVIRAYILTLSEQKHNAGGVRNLFGALRAYFNWYADEVAPHGWQNPMKKVKSPRVPVEAQETLHLGDLQKLLDTCVTRQFVDARDRAILLFLLDTGVRRQELADLNLEDVNMDSGQALIRQGKGRKPRNVFFGRETRKALQAYFRTRDDRHDPSAPLWIMSASHGSDRMAAGGIREIIRRRAIKANVKEPSFHEFRRACAINMWRSGADVATIQRILGHESIMITMRYLNLENEDIRQRHITFGAVDHALQANKKKTGKD